MLANLLVAGLVVVIALICSVRVATWRGVQSEELWDVGYWPVEDECERSDP